MIGLNVLDHKNEGALTEGRLTTTRYNFLLNFKALFDFKIL